ncbi:ATP-binding protein [Niallia sp. 03133]|uniref:ATP-binding protein n=1 Tax=Niallia sp. 03133 TaxID=3458060 RepID=UPI004044840C
MEKINETVENSCLKRCVRLQQIIVNSLHAIKDRKQGELIIRLKYDGKNAFIAVEDNGYGILQEEQNNIFEKIKKI